MAIIEVCDFRIYRGLLVVPVDVDESFRKLLTAE